MAAAVAEILATGALTLGPYTKRFEAAFAAAHDAPHAVAVSSGTAALHIVLSAAGGRAGAGTTLSENTCHSRLVDSGLPLTFPGDTPWEDPNYAVSQLE